jgi:hypothetical protein
MWCMLIGTEEKRGYAPMQSSNACSSTYWRICSAVGPLLTSLHNDLLGPCFICSQPHPCCARTATTTAPRLQLLLLTCEVTWSISLYLAICKLFAAATLDVLNLQSTCFQGLWRTEHQGLPAGAPAVKDFTYLHSLWHMFVNIVRLVQLRVSRGLCAQVQWIASQNRTVQLSRVKPTSWLEKHLCIQLPQIWQNSKRKKIHRLVISFQNI